MSRVLALTKVLT